MTRVVMTFLDGTKEVRDFLYSEYSEVWRSGSYQGKRIDTWSVDGWTVQFPHPPIKENDQKL